jgi:hypothetical protein
VVGNCEILFCVLFYVTLLGLDRFKFGALPVHDSGTCSVVLGDYPNDPQVRTCGDYSGVG